MYAITDLAACYDWQLANIEGMVLELTGIERKATRLFTKILPIMIHHIYSRFEVSHDTYRSKLDLIRGTSQDNSFSGEIYKQNYAILLVKLGKKN